MTVSTLQAAREAAAFLAPLSHLTDCTDVRQVTGSPYPPLSLGAVRALAELAQDLVTIARVYPPGEVERAIAG